MSVQIIMEFLIITFFIIIAIIILLVIRDIINSFIRNTILKACSNVRRTRKFVYKKRKRKK